MPSCRAIAVHVVLGWALITNCDVAAAQTASGCPDVRRLDFAAPLRALPAVRHLPSGGTPAFAPRGLTIRSLVRQGFALQVDEAGFEVSASGGSALTHAYRLGWRAELITVAVDRRGRITRRLKVRRVFLTGRHVYGVEPVDIVIRGIRGQEVYRSELVIRNSSGQRLGAFGEYFRVLKRRLGYRLALGAPSAQASEIVYFKVENTGTVGMELGDDVDLERHAAPGSWERIEQGVGSGATAIGVPAGQPGPCQRIVLPPDLLAGNYSLSKTISPLSSQVIDLHAPFRVD